MNDHEDTLSVSQDSLALKINEIESRIDRLESELAVVRTGRGISVSNENDEQLEMPHIGFSGDSIESSFGEFGLAWLGNIVLLFGIIFLVQYFQRSELSMVSAVFGYFAVAGLFGIGYMLRNSHPNMASIFRLNGYILLFIITLLLHFLVTSPLVTSAFVAIVLLLAVSVAQMVIGIRKGSEGLTGLAIFMGLATAVLSDKTHIMLPLAVIFSIISLWLLQRRGWWRLLLFTIIFVYLVNLVWFLGNPVMGHPVAIMKVHHLGYLYLFVIAAVFSLIALISKQQMFGEGSAISAIILNGLGFSMLLTFYVLSFFKDDYVILFGSIALFCLLYAIILQSRSNWKVTASLYALYSFVALSVTVFGIYGFPRAYTLLAIQSLLVVTMALWFRSKVIVVMNTFLFMGLLLAYLTTTATVNSANVSFALVALITARTLNWQRQRLNIKTELLRNTYLIIGFFMVLYALYRIMPDNYVTVSWSVAAILYFVLSFVLRNIKYRYLALGTMVATALYLFIVDLARVEIIFRVVAFLFLAVISILLSLYYTKSRSKKSDMETMG